MPFQIGGVLKMTQRKKISVPLQRQVKERDKHRCAYCHSPKEIGITLVFDHIIPLIAGGETILENLALCCFQCNAAKGKRTAAIDPKTGEYVALFHPRQQEWHKHFEWSSDNLRIIGKTAIGRATVHALRLNADWLVDARGLWKIAGVHPELD